MLHLVYLDRYHLDDILYLDQLGRTLAQGKQRPPLVFVHGSGEEAERLLEAEAVVPRRLKGRLDVTEPAHHALVARAIRHANQGVVARLTEAGVPAVGFQGSDRGMLRLTETGIAAKAVWLRAWAAQGAVPVVSSLVRAGDEQVESEPARVLHALARALDAPVTLLARANRPGILEAGAVVEKMAASRVDAAVFSEPEMLREVLDFEARVLLTSAGGLASAPVAGTWLQPEEASGV